MRFISILSALLTVSAVLTSCQKEDSSYGLLNCRVEKVSANSVTVIFSAEIPSNVTGYIVGARASTEDPQKYHDSVTKYVTASSGKNNYRITVSGLNPETRYNIRAYMGATLLGPITWGDMASFTTSKAVIGTPVDLGLSVKWANMNVGASVPEDFGCYFAWGETEPKSSYDQQNYKYWDENTWTWTKYCENPSRTGRDILLEKSDDAASVNWGGKWRMPTHEEWKELLNTDNCLWTWTTINDINGYKVQSKKPGFTDKWIFLPAAEGSSVLLGRLGLNIKGLYWSSSLAYSLEFDQLNLNCYGEERYYGLPVRPVLDN